MGVTVWVRRAVPDAGPGAVWQARPGNLGELAPLRRSLRTALAEGGLPAGADRGERLLMVCEELVSNALRHGRHPVDVTVTETARGWLLAVSDAAGDRLPVRALDRDPRHGGLGLPLVGRICPEHGFSIEGDRKIVWARVPYLERLPVQRVRQATARSIELVVRTTETAAEIAATLDELSARAGADDRPIAASAYRMAAVRARLESERGRWMTIASTARSARNS
jgi:anti-sigma regulatory factor (Ser/Thr protein kinase)